jgi:DUF1365 family protein
MKKIAEKPFILAGKIMHARTFPKANKFTYSNTFFSIPLKKISFFKSRFFSFNKNNLFCLNDKNYRHWLDIEKILQNYQITGVKNITLVTQAKILGYIFNPVSFYLCFDAKHLLIAVLAEVNNRSKQTHSYLIFNKNLSEIEQNQWFNSDKKFYVSPFLEPPDQDGKYHDTYKFRFVINNSEAAFYINCIDRKKLILSTYLICKYKEFNDKNLLIEFLKHPFSSFKTTFLIHYQALKLALKGLKFNRCPTPPKNQITVNLHD